MKRQQKKKPIVYKLNDFIKTTTRCKVECSICDYVEKENDTSEDKFCAELEDVGWTAGSSAKFQIIGPFCPICSETEDEKRGE